MKLIEELLEYRSYWSEPDIYLFTGNTTRTSTGELVMGAGAAKVVKELFPDLPAKIDTSKPVTFHQIRQWQIIGYFRVKDDWKEPAKIKLLMESTLALKRIAQRKPAHTFHMNAPGIGAGKLQWRDVKAIIAQLPDNVWIYKG